MTDDVTRGGGAVFATTCWTQVRAARGGSDDARAALSDLCAAYWAPVHRFLAREGRGDDEARELAQEFFARLLRGGVGGADPSRGRFRSYLLGALRHFLGDRRRHEARAKRGGGATAESLDAVVGGDAGEQVADPAAGATDAWFDRAWAFSVLERSFAALERELEAAGKGAQLEVLKPWLAGGGGTMDTAAAARALGIGEGAVKVAVHRLRKRFREQVRDEIGRTVSGPDEVDDELRYFVEVLASTR